MVPIPMVLDLNLIYNLFTQNEFVNLKYLKVYLFIKNKFNILMNKLFSIYFL